MMDVNATMTGDLDSSMFTFMVNPVTTWTLAQWFIFPALFVVPGEILAGTTDLMIYYSVGSQPGLPGKPKEEREPLPFYPDICYIAFNRLVLLPFVSLIIVQTVWNSNAIVWDFKDMSILNTLLGFVATFALADLVYYTGHRIVHRYRWLYNIVHKHHHQESQPIRGWVDTCNAHPTDFFYTGLSTCPASVLWLFPAQSVHIVAIALCLYVNLFVGALGHCRLDINIGIFNTRFHAGHHALSICNFAQNIELWDRLFGTYRDLPMPKAEKLK